MHSTANMPDEEATLYWYYFIKTTERTDAEIFKDCVIVTKYKQDSRG